MPLKTILIGLPHGFENLIESLVGLTVGIVIYPVYESVFSVKVLVNSGAFKNGVKSFLGVGLHDELFVLHQLNNSVEATEVLENLAHTF